MNDLVQTLKTSGGERKRYTADEVLQIARLKFEGNTRKQIAEAVGRSENSLQFKLQWIQKLIETNKIENDADLERIIREAIVSK
jgi:DNA-binding NarL/FixJ family response regulator